MSKEKVSHATPQKMQAMNHKDQRPGDASHERMQGVLSKLKDRVDALVFLRGRNAPSAACAGLASAAHLLHTLAARFLKPQSHWPGHEHLEVSQVQREGWLLEWYFGYCQALLELGEAARLGVQNEALTLRSVNSRVPLTAAELAPWMSLDLRAEMRARMDQMFKEGASWSAAGFPNAAWPDAVGIPLGAVYPQDADQWAVGAGIAEPGEVASLLRMQSQDAAEALISQGASPNLHINNKADDEWTARAVQARHDQLVKENGGRDHGVTKQVALESGYSTRKVRHMITEAKAAMIAVSAVPTASIFAIGYSIKAVKQKRR